MKIIKMFLVILMCAIVLVPGSVYAATSTEFEVDVKGNYTKPVNPNEEYGSGDELIKITGTVDKIWGSVILIVQIVSVACVVFAGVRYMYASPDKKADIKTGLMYLVIGAVFVFAASTVIRFVFNIGTSVMTGT